MRLDPEDPTRTPQIGLLDAGLAYEVTDHKSFLDVVYHLMLCEGHAAGLGTGSQPPGVIVSRHSREAPQCDLSRVCSTPSKEVPLEIDRDSALISCL